MSVPSAISSAGFEAGANANAFAEYLSCNRWRVVVECIQDAELEPVSADAVGKIVVELFLRDGRLPHAKAAKRSCRDDIGMYGASERAVVRDLIGSGSVHWDALRNGPPLPIFRGCIRSAAVCTGVIERLKAYAASADFVF